MTTEEDIRRRNRFSCRWSDLLIEAAGCAHFVVYHAHEAAEGGKEASARLLRAAWGLAELERDDAPAVGWVRYWFRGELLPLPCELLSQRDELGRQLDEERERLLAAESEVARLRAELEALGRQTGEGP